MIQRQFGKTGWTVSVIGQGCWNIGNQWGEMDDATAEAIIRAAYDGGMTLFDTAESYGLPNGMSEIRLGRALKGIRDNVKVVSKIGNWGKRTGQAVPKTTADMIRVCGHACAGRMRIDCVDLMLCHDGRIEDPSVYIEGFERLRDEGFIREYGISTNSLDVLRKFNDVSGGKCAAVELDYSLMNLEPEKEMLPYCREKSLGVLIRGPVAKGLLSGKHDENSVFTDAVRSNWNHGAEGREAFKAKLAKVEKIRQVAGDDMVTTALRFVVSHPAAPVAIPGATSVAQATANAAAGDELLSEEQCQALRAVC
ncbi:MAG: aldo/keto reductase [Planctomycetes bacterium]|nr:aldo/keto reductase [Planctomycetota bacterium]